MKSDFKLLGDLGLNRIPNWKLGLHSAALLASVPVDFLRQEMANGNLPIIEPLPEFRRIRFVDLVNWFEVLPVPWPQKQLENYERFWRKTLVQCPEKELDRDYVRALTQHAFKLGNLVRKRCEICGRENAQAHHDDYSKPLEVRFLCGLHHRRFHLGLPYDYEPKYPARKNAFTQTLNNKAAVLSPLKVGTQLRQMTNHKIQIDNALTDGQVQVCRRRSQVTTKGDRLPNPVLWFGSDVYKDQTPATESPTRPPESLLISKADNKINRILAAHDEISLLGKKVLDKAIKLGGMLAEVREQIPHGEWLPWLEQNLPQIPDRTVQRYLQLWENRETIKEELQIRHDDGFAKLPTIQDALALIKKPKPAKRSTPPKGKRALRPLQTIEVDAVELHAAGGGDAVNLAPVTVVATPADVAVGTPDDPVEDQLSSELPRCCPTCGRPWLEGGSQ
jgi:hypothetical protein